MTTDNERWLNDPEIVRDPNMRTLFYDSKALGRQVILTEVLSLHVDDLKVLRAECQAHLDLIYTGEIPFKDRIESLPEEQAKGLKYKNFINFFFRRVCDEEIGWRRLQFKTDQLKQAAKVHATFVEFIEAQLGKEECDQLMAIAQATTSE
jgi:hypothetical protein